MSANNSFRIRMWAGLAVAILAVSCSEDSERNIILDTAPFFQQDIRYEPGGDGRIIASVRRFAGTNQMDFLLARDSLPPGEFNVTAASHELNLEVIHTSPIDPPWHAKSMPLPEASRAKPIKRNFKSSLRSFEQA